MSVKATSEGSDSDLSEDQQQLEEFLLEEVDELTYFKSRLIAEKLGHSSKSVGSNMRRLADCSTALLIEKWGYSSGTTWMVQQQE